MRFESLRDSGRWVECGVWTDAQDWRGFCEAAKWIGPVRMVDASGLVVREFHPAGAR